MMRLPARHARWVGLPGSSARLVRQGNGRSGVYRRFYFSAYRPALSPPPPCAHSIPIGTVTGSHAFVTPPFHIQGDLLPDRTIDAAQSGQQPVDVGELHRLVLEALDDDQAVDIVSIPLEGKSNIADYMVIASGRSTRQVASMANKLAERVKQTFGKSVRIEGLPAADWVLIDADDVIVHLFRPEVRSFYNLERMWAFGDEVPTAATARRG